MSLSIHSSRIIKCLLFANRSEIAIRVIRVANELEILTVAVYAKEDKYLCAGLRQMNVIKSVKN